MAARRTASHERELNELLTRDRTLNGAILFGLDGHVVEMQARAMEILRVRRPDIWSAEPCVRAFKGASTRLFRHRMHVLRLVVHFFCPMVPPCPS